MGEVVGEEFEMTGPRVSMAYLPYSADGMGNRGLGTGAASGKSCGADPGIGVGASADGSDITGQRALPLQIADARSEVRAALLLVPRHDVAVVGR